MNRLIKIGKKIFPLNRSLTGNDNLKTLTILKTEVPKLKIKYFPCNKKVYDWRIPDEWNLKKAYIKDKFNKKIIDIKKNNLHVVSYSTKINKNITLKKLLKKIYSNKKIKNAIPYVTSYYHKNWGFCLSEDQKKKIIKKYKKNDLFKVVIDSNFKKKGKMHYGEIFIPGKNKEEILITTYICHPSMANNELSGPLVSLALAKFFMKKKLKCSLRFLFTPETIGAVSYINENFKKLKKDVKGGYVLSCIGDERNYSLMLSKYSNSISDIAAIEAYKQLSIKFKKYSFLTRGSDERQYNSPFINLGLSGIMRTKYAKYKEYHTSLDQFDTVVTAKGLKGGFKVAKKAILNLDVKKRNQYNFLKNKKNPIAKFICEPQLSKRNLTYQISNLAGGRDESNTLRKNILNFLQYADGSNSLVEISKIIKLKTKTLNMVAKICKKHNLIKSIQ